LHGLIKRSPVESLVDGKPGRSGEAQGMRHYPHVAQASPLEQPEELAANPGMRHRRIQDFSDSAHEHRVRCVDDGLIGVEVKGQHGSTRTRQAHHLSYHCFRSVRIAQDALGPAQIETAVREPDLVGVTDFEAEGQGQTRAAPAGLGDHGWVDIDPDHSPLRPHLLGEAAYLMPESAAHVQNLIPRPNRTDIEHPPLDLLNQRTFVGTIEPAEDRLGATGLTRLLEALMQTAHRGRTLLTNPVPHLSTTRCICRRLQCSV